MIKANGAITINVTKRNWDGKITCINYAKGPYNFKRNPKIKMAYIEDKQKSIEKRRWEQKYLVKNKSDSKQRNTFTKSEFTEKQFKEIQKYLEEKFLEESQDIKRLEAHYPQNISLNDKFLDNIKMEERNLEDKYLEAHYPKKLPLKVTFLDRRKLEERYLDRKII
jgi:hypothetical protein